MRRNRASPLIPFINRERREDKPQATPERGKAKPLAIQKRNYAL